MATLRVELNAPQAEFLKLDKKFKAFVAGFGSGKTYVGCADLAKHFIENPGVAAGYFAPTYPQIRDIFYPTAEEAMAHWGLDVSIKESNKEVEVYCAGSYRGTIICRSMERPETIVGFKIGKAMVDEIDVMAPAKASNAWRKIIARLRHNDAENGISVTTTPEGFRFVHSQFVKQPQLNPSMDKFYGYIQASTYDNEANLPPDYIDSLLSTYPENLISAYIHGQFVNLKTGNVYSSFNRMKNYTDATITEKDSVLHIGMDFNVGKMAAITHIVRENQPLAVDEIVNAFDTPDMIKRIKERYWRYEDERYVQTRQIVIYPDSSGDSRKSVNASETDIMLLKAAGFRVNSPNTNPPVKDRINSMTAMFCNAAGQRRYLVNAAACPTFTESLEQQAWADNGEPDKSTGHDHANDAAGYFIHRMFPIVRRSMTTQEVLL